MKDVTAEPNCADVCLILEGTYPYVSGGVSSWVQDLILAQSHLSFHLLILLAPDSQRDLRYSIPENVVGLTEITLQKLPAGAKKITDTNRTMQQIEIALSNLSHEGGLRDVASLLQIFTSLKEDVGRLALLDSRAAWDMLLRMYKQDFSKSSFLDYFWTWRGLFGGMYSALLGPLPPARVYHAVSTGYAGLCLARAKLETGRPAMVTEHGIYTNERCIEIAMADWLHEDKHFPSMAVHKTHRDLQDMWMHSFQSYSRACYEACDEIITLYGGNQTPQLHHGATKDRMRVIPNGINYESFSSIQHNKESSDGKLNVALIGRVVPIKDVKTYIRAFAQVHKELPHVHGYMLGPYDEDPEYYEECKELVDYLGLESSFTFTGSVNLMEWLGRIDLIVLTSISEAQPLVILEAGAAGVPCVATDVGACREMIEGDSRESPSLGLGGVIVPLSSPSLVAQAIIGLMSDPAILQRSGEAMKERVRLYYNKNDLKETYRKLYEKYCNFPTQDVVAERLS